MEDLIHASKEKKVDDHSVIDDAIKDQAEVSETCRDVEEHRVTLGNEVQLVTLDNRDTPYFLYPLGSSIVLQRLR